MAAVGKSLKFSA